MRKIAFRYASFRLDECGATAIEYGLIAAIAALGLAAGIGALSDEIISVFGTVSSNVETVAQESAQ